MANRVEIPRHIGLGGRSGLSLALFVAVSLAACATQPSTPDAARAPVTKALAAQPDLAAGPAEQADARQGLGIRVTALRLSAGGFMLDLRYRVVDPERAKLLLDRRVPAYLVDEASGAKLGVPTTAKLGKLRQGTLTNIQTDRDYGMLFGNPGRFLKPGASVTLVAGDVQMRNLIIH